VIVLVKNTCHPILCRIFTRNLNVILQSMAPNKSLHPPSEMAAEGGPLEANLIENYLRPRDWLIH